MAGRPRTRDKCSVEGCDSPHRAKGYCTGHYARKRAGLKMDGPIARRPGGPPAKQVGCAVDGCDREHYGRGLCVNHYNQDRRRRMQNVEGEPE